MPANWSKFHFEGESCFQVLKPAHVQKAILCYQSSTGESLSRWHRNYAWFGLFLTVIREIQKNNFVIREFQSPMLHKLIILKTVIRDFCIGFPANLYCNLNLCIKVITFSGFVNLWKNYRWFVIDTLPHLDLFCNIFSMTHRSSILNCNTIMYFIILGTNRELLVVVVATFGVQFYCMRDFCQFCSECTFKHLSTAGLITSTLYHNNDLFLQNHHHTLSHNDEY